MARPLGKQALCLLATMGSPFSIVIVPDKVARQLIARGLLAHRPHPTKKTDGFYAITAAGLRTLADAVERGDIEQFFDPRFVRDRVRMFIDGKKEAS